MTGKDETHRSIDLSIEIDAPADVVWDALTDAEQLRAWFAPEAEVQAGSDGKVTLGWGGDSGTSAIEVWQPERHLRWVERFPGRDGPVRVAVDFYLQGHGGGTLLRLVQSGFEEGADWDEFVDTLESGWGYFLWHLQQYLQRHRGASRRLVWRRLRVQLPKAELWARLLEPDGLVSVGEPRAPGSAATLWSGEVGEVAICRPPIHLGARFGTLNDALLLVELEPGAPAYSLGVWLSLYGLPEARSRAIETALARRLRAMGLEA